MTHSRIKLSPRSIRGRAYRLEAGISPYKYGEWWEYMNMDDNERPSMRGTLLA